MSRITSRLRIRPGAQPTRDIAAWLIAGNDPQAWLAELAAWNVPLVGLKLLAVPRSVHDRGPLGALVIGATTARPTSPRCLPYAVVAGQMYLPVDARFDPPVSEAELLMLLGDGLATHVWHPAAGLIGFEKDDVLNVGSLLVAPPQRTTAWDRAQPGLAVCRRLVSIEARDLPTADNMFEQGRDDIGTRSPHEDELPPSPHEPGQGVAHDVGRRARQAIAKVVQSLTNLAPRLAQQPTWVNKLDDWAQRQLEAVSRALEASRQREILRLLNLLSTHPDEGLKYALPLAGHQHRGVAPPSARLGPRDVNFNLGRLGGGQAGDSWNISHELHVQLMARYRALAEREIRLGRHRRAAYILAELLGDLRAAATTLAAGNHWREAAVLYRDRLNSKQEAAECLEKGGLWSEAIALHRELHNYERAGDLHARLEQPELAEAAYHEGVASFLSGYDFINAARLLETKLDDADEALGMLQRSWPHSTQARQCLRGSLDLLGRLGRHETTVRRVRALGEQSLSSKQIGELVEVLAETAAGYPNSAVKLLAADTVRTVVSRRLPQATLNESGPLLAAIRSLVPEDRLLARDCQRYVQQLPRPLPVRLDRNKLRIVQAFELGTNVDWEVVASIGEEFYAAGYSRQDPAVCLFVSADYQYKIRSPSNPPWRVPLPGSPLLLAPDPRGAQPVILAAAGKPPLEHSFILPRDSSSRATAVGTPDWLPSGLLAVCRVSHGMTWALSHHKGRTVLNGYDAGHSLIATRDVPVTESVDLQLDEEGPPRIALYARHDAVYVGLGNGIFAYELGDDCCLTLLPDFVQSLCGSAPHTRRRIVATLVRGAAVYWDNCLNPPERFGLDLHEPVAGFTTSGCVVLAARGKLEVYASQKNRLQLVAEDDYPTTPLAAFAAPHPDQITLCDTDGGVRVYELPRLA